MRKLLFFLFVLLTLGATAQVDNVYVYGTVKDYSSGKKLDGITVTVYKNGAKLTDVVTNASGKYEFNLDYGADYKIMYAKPGLVGKNIQIDTRNIPEEERVGGHGMNIEMTLFSELPGIDFAVLDKPIGKAKFDPATNEVTWDLEYTEQIRNEIARLMKEYEDKQKREANLEEDFAKAMQQGDAAMAQSDYKKAVASFTEALTIKPKEPVATAKLSDAQMRLDDQEGEKKKDEQYATLIKDADGLYNKKEYENAKSKYLEASGIKDKEVYPKQKVKEIEGILADLAKKAEEERKAKELKDKYDAAIAAADGAFKSENYDQAKTKYTEAAGLMPDEKYPKDQLAAIDKKLEELAKKAEEERKQRELDANYQAAIAAADASFKAENYDQARTKYTEASGLKPDEKYPKDQLAAIDKKLEELAKKAEEERKKKELQDQYDAAIAAADAAFHGEKYDEAKTRYTDALGLKPDEKYPKDQLTAIDKKLEELARKAEEERKAKELQDQYDAVIAAADAAFHGEKYDEAKGKYNDALGLKPGEKYPKDQLAAIDKKLEELARKAEEERHQKELDEQYQALIDDGDKLFRKEEFEAARAKFVSASDVKPDKRYPKDRIAEIDATLAEQARKAEEERKQRELEARYAELIASADKAYDLEQWTSALNDYQDALQLKPGERHPQERIAEIGSKLDAQAREQAEKERQERERRERDAQYAQLLAKADQAMGAKKYDEAKTNYTDASSVKPEEQYPRDKLAEIASILEEQARKAREDSLAAQQAADEKARQDALERKRLEEQEAIEKEYRELIAAADLALGQKDYDEARDKYTRSLTVKPDEQYPKDKLAEIEDTLADAAKRRSDAERLAEEQRRAEEERRRKAEADAEAARLAAQAERDRLEAAKAVEARYNEAIAQADLAFTDKDYDGARSLYTQALDIKPDETYPASRIEQIDKLLEAEAERRRQAAEAAAQKANKETPVRSHEQGNTIDFRKEQEAEQFMREARMREEAEKYERIKKLKHDVSEEERSNAEEAAERRDSGIKIKERHEFDQQALYQGSEEQRLANAEAVQAFKDALARTESDRQAQEQEERRSTYEADRDRQQATVDVIASRNELHEKAVEDAQARAKAIQQEQADLAHAGRQRNANAREEVSAQAERQKAIQERGDAIAHDNQEKLAMDKDLAYKRSAQLAERSADQRMAERERIQGTPLNQPKDYADYNRSKLAQEYPQGVTEESYTEGNKVIIRRVVVDGNKADEYSKVIAKWGTYYFRNGQSITEMIWNTETEGR
ncbi:MAG: hypothetical protein H6594_07505 [Flavobacteriales bacterium]|nr:hypothetical protein [Flavobacteriales bacterium]